MPKGHFRRHLKLPLANLAPVKPPPPEVSITFDDREDEDAFRRLSPEAQEEMRAAWAEQDARVVRRKTLVTTTRTRSMLQAAAVFLFIETTMAFATWPHTIAAAIVGAAVGVWWHRIGAGRMQCIWTSALPYAALRVAFPCGSLGWDALYGILGFLMLAGLTGLVGFARESRVADFVLERYRRKHSRDDWPRREDVEFSKRRGRWRWNHFAISTCRRPW